MTAGTKPESNAAAEPQTEAHQPAMKLMRWGLIPSWAKDESVGNAHINARSETLPSRNAFREAFKQRRCLIPADNFYEWQEREGKRQPFRVMLKSGEQFCLAGLWEKWIKPPSWDHAETGLDEAPPSETIESFTIITRAANEAIAPLHDRMAGCVLGAIHAAPRQQGGDLRDLDAEHLLGQDVIHALLPVGHAPFKMHIAGCERSERRCIGSFGGHNPKLTAARLETIR